MDLSECAVAAGLVARAVMSCPRRKTCARDLVVTEMWQSLLQNNSEVARMLAWSLNAKLQHRQEHGAGARTRVSMSGCVSAEVDSTECSHNVHTWAHHQNSKGPELVPSVGVSGGPNRTEPHPADTGPNPFRQDEVTAL